MPDDSSGFVTELWARPDELSRLARYTIANGLLYMGLGAAVMFAPPAFLAPAFFLDGLEGTTLALARSLGIALFFVGWFYVMGGRTGATSFGLATVVDRLFLPFLMAFFVLTDQIPLMTALPLAVLDPLLGLGALAVWWTEPG